MAQATVIWKPNYASKKNSKMFVICIFLDSNQNKREMKDRRKLFSSSIQVLMLNNATTSKVKNALAKFII